MKKKLPGLAAIFIAVLAGIPAISAVDPHVGTYANKYGKIVIRHINLGNYALIVEGNRHKCVFRVAASPIPSEGEAIGLCANAREKKYGSICVNIADGLLSLDQEKIQWEELGKSCEGLKDAGSFVKVR